MNTKIFDIKERLIVFASTKNGKAIQFITDKSLVADLKSLFPEDFFFRSKQLTIKKMAALVLFNFNEPTCEHCGISVCEKFPWRDAQTTPERITPYGSWARVCSTSCSQHLGSTTAKRTATMLDKYGVTNIMQKPGFAKEAMKNRKTDWIAAGITQQKNNLIKRGVSQEFIDSIDFMNPESKVQAILAVAEDFTIKHGREPTRFELCEITKIHKILLNRWLADVPKYSHLFHSNSSVSSQQIEIKTYIESLGFSVRMSDRTILKPREIDLVIEEKKIGIEFCGVWCHSEGYDGTKPAKYHISKTDESESAGYQLLCIYDTEWNDPIGREIWKSIICHKLGITNRKIYARQCDIREINPVVCNAFMDENHLQGHVRTTNHIGLYYQDELVMAMSFGKSRTSEQTEIIRMASKRNMSVVGGVSKLMNFVKKTAISILCFADRRYSSVHKCGYTNSLVYTDMTGPNWWGFNRKEYVLYSRHKFMKHKLKSLIGERYDETKTAFENMIDNGYDRIWDSGSLKFEWYKN